MEYSIIQKIVRGSGICAGERVLIHFWGEDAEKAVANGFMAATASLGATPVLLQQSRSVNRQIFSTADAACFDAAYFRSLGQFDTVLDLFAYQPITLGEPLEEPQQELYRRYIRQLFGALMQSKRFLQIRIPTAANAAESGLDPDDYIRRMQDAYDVDYTGLRQQCSACAASLSCHDRLVLQTGKDHRLTFTLTERKWHIDAGDGDLPCGEIYIAPIEEKTSGSVRFESLHWEDLGKFENVTLQIDQGRVTAASIPEIQRFLEQQPPENTVICELGLGMNPHVSSLCGYTVLDEKMAGTFHIALGANRMFGGENEAAIHLDLVGTGAFSLTGEEAST